MLWINCVCVCIVQCWILDYDMGLQRLQKTMYTAYSVCVYNAIVNLNESYLWNGIGSFSFYAIL